LKDLLTEIYDFTHLIQNNSDLNNKYVAR